MITAYVNEIPAGASRAGVGGTPFWVPLFANRQGAVRTLRVIQATGAMEGFSYALYASSRAVGANGAVADGGELYRVAPDVAVAAPGTGAAVNGFGLSHAFQVREDAGTQHRDRLWLRISPLGTGAKSFDIALTLESDPGRD